MVKAPSSKAPPPETPTYGIWETNVEGAVSWYHSALTSSQLQAVAAKIARCICLLGRNEKVIWNFLDVPNLEGWYQDDLRNRLHSIVEEDRMDLEHRKIAVEMALDAKASGMVLRRHDFEPTFRARFTNYSHAASLMVPHDCRPPRKE